MTHRLGGLKSCAQKGTITRQRVSIAAELNLNAKRSMKAPKTIRHTSYGAAQTAQNAPIMPPQHALVNMVGSIKKSSPNYLFHSYLIHCFFGTLPPDFEVSMSNDRMYAAIFRHWHRDRRHTRPMRSDHHLAG